MAPSIAQEPINQPEIEVKKAFDEKAHESVSILTSARWRK
jgi:hypothetical protein